MTPEVSIVIVNYKKPEVIDRCLQTLAETEGSYEVIVVDNASGDETVRELRTHLEAGRIDKLICEETNWLFSEGNNIGVRHSDSGSKYILLLNSDVAFRRPDWLQKVIGWMEGTVEYRPAVWDFHPTVVEPGPRDIISVGWSHDANVYGNARAEGWCIMFRREWWAEMSPDFPWHYGIDEMVCKQVRAGARCGLLSQYSPYLVHREGGSGKPGREIVNARQPDLAGWFDGLHFETLDFTLGPNEHDSYLVW